MGREGWPPPEAFSQESEEQSETLAFPHGDAVIELFKKAFPEEGAERVERAKEIFDTFFKQELDNAKLYTSEKHNASFPYTKIHIGELAKALFEKHGGTMPAIESPVADSGAENRSRKEFVFQSFLTTDNGNILTFVEEAMEKSVQYLPHALEDLKNGREPENREIITVGSPTNRVGTVSPEFADAIAADPYGELGSLYAEFVHDYLGETPSPAQKQSVEFYGISMGAGIAAKTGEALLEKGQATQDPETETNLPFLQIRADVPVALSETKRKSVQIPVGFLADGAVLLATSPYNRKVGMGEHAFLPKMQEVLDAKGMPEHMDDEQKNLKQKSLKKIVKGLWAGMPLKPETKVNTIIGLKDPTMYSPTFNHEAKKHRREHAGSLGENLVPRKVTDKGEPSNVRTFSVDMSHVHPYFRGKDDQEKLRRAAIALESLDK